MLSFKQFIKFYLAEAIEKHFAHIGLDINNQKHKDMLDMFNKHSHSLTKKNPNQYKSLDELHAAVKPHLDKLEQDRAEEKEGKKAFETGDVKLIHHDPKTGVKVFKVHSSKGCVAVGGDTKWCVSHRESGDGAFKSYDPTGEHSYVIHTPEKGNLSKIGIIGLKPGENHGGNFQHKGNVTVSDQDWGMLRKKYNLDNVKELHGIRGLKNPEIQQENKIKSADLLDRIKMKSSENIEDDLKHAAKYGYLNADHVHHYGNDKGNVGLGFLADHSNDPEVHKAIVGHKNAGDDALTTVARKSDDPEMYKAIINHKNAGDDALTTVARKSDDPEFHKAIINHKNAGDYILTTVARKSDDPEMHKAIINHKNAGDVALGIVAYKSNDPEMHKAIINHKNAGDDTLGIVARKSDDPEMHKAIANHKNAGDYALNAIVYKSNDPEFHKAIINHKNAGDVALGIVARKSDDPEVHKAIINHKNAGGYALSAVADKSNDPEMHKAIANHKNAGDVALGIVARKSNDPEIHK